MQGSIPCSLSPPPESIASVPHLAQDQEGWLGQDKPLGPSPPSLKVQ